MSDTEFRKQMQEMSQRMEDIETRIIHIQIALAFVLGIAAGELAFRIIHTAWRFGQSN